MTWSPSSKLSVVLNGGVDHREFLNQSRDTLETPVYSLTVQYAPVETTTFALTAGRDISESLFANESTKDTQWRATLKQRLLKHYLLTANFGRYDSDYIYNETAEGTGRSDKDLSGNVRLTWPILKRGTFGLLYQWGRNTSTASGYAFSSHQIGFEIGYKY